MPIIYEYLGIIIRFYSNEHEPIHVHAIYDGNIIKVEFLIKDGKIYRTNYNVVKGNFPPAKLKLLKNFISVFKLKIVWNWERYFIWKMKVEKQVITTKKLTNEDSYN